MRPRNRYLLVALGSTLSGIMQATTITFFGEPFVFIRPALLFAILLFVFGRRTEAFVAALLAGTILDVYSFVPGIPHVIRFIAAMVVVTYIGQAVLTNRSPYATALLMIVGRATEAILVIGWAIGGSVLGRTSFPAESWWSFVQQGMWDVAIVVSVFFIFTQFSRRFLVTASRN